MGGPGGSPPIAADRGGQAVAHAPRAAFDRGCRGLVEDVAQGRREQLEPRLEVIGANCRDSNVHGHRIAEVGTRAEQDRRPEAAHAVEMRRPRVGRDARREHWAELSVVPDLFVEALDELPNVDLGDPGAHAKNVDGFAHVGVDGRISNMYTVYMFEDQPVLPDGATRIGESPEFTNTTTPAALREHHSTGPERWARLRVFAGSLRFDDLERQRSITVGAGQDLVIAPGAAHRVAPDDEARFQLEFYRES